MADRVIGGGKYKVGDRVNTRLEILEKYLSKARDRHEELLQMVDELEDQISKLEEKIVDLQDRSFVSLRDQIWEL